MLLKRSSFRFVQQSARFSFTTLRQSQEHIQQLIKLRRSETSNWIPSSDSTESIGVTAWITSSRDLRCQLNVLHSHQELVTYIRECSRILIQRRIHEAHGTFASCKTLLINQRDDARKDRCGGAGPAHELRLAVRVEQDVETDSRDIGVAATGGVVVRVTVGSEVVGRQVLLEVVFDGGLLVVGGWPVVAKATAGPETLVWHGDGGFGAVVWVDLVSM